MRAPLRLDIPLQPKQELLLKMMETKGSPRNIAYGGARGGAKSHAARAIMLLRRINHPGTKGLFLRRSFPELMSNHIIPMFEHWPQLRRYYNAQTKILELPTNPKSYIEFRTANDEGRIARIKGSEFLDVDVEEATDFFEEDIVWLQTVNRYAGPLDVEPHMLLTCNPGGVGHAYIKRVFVDRDFQGNEKPEDYGFIQSYAQDNVIWSLAALRKEGLGPRDYYAWTDEERFKYFVEKSDYGRVLNSLPDALKGPHLYGDWTFFAGQYFDVLGEHSKFCRNECTHNDPSHKVVTVEKWWPRWIGMDWGFEDQSAIYWFAADPAGNEYCYREVVINHTTGDKLGALIGQITQRAGERVEDFFLSRDAFARKQSERTIADEIEEGLRPYSEHVPAPTQADQDRVGGAQLCYQLLENRQLYISRSCRNLLKLLPQLMRDVPDNPNDVLAIKGDDPYDGFRYGVKTRARAAERPRGSVVQERLKALNLQDPTSVMIERRRILAELEREDEPARLAPYLGEAYADVGR